MGEITYTNLNHLRSEDLELQNNVFFAILEATAEPVDWAYAASDDLLADLRHKENHVRAIVAQVLCNLA